MIEFKKKIAVFFMAVALITTAISCLQKIRNNVFSDEEIKSTEIINYNQNGKNNNGILESSNKEIPIVNLSRNISFVDIDVKDIYKQDIYIPYGKGYRYGPSIIRDEDGLINIWMSSPGNNSTEWDYIRYINGYDRTDWSGEEVVLRPTKYSQDQCSTCDPGVIYFNGYYYLGYTSTADQDRGGTNNHIFVARSEYPDGPFEKWNGEGWGGDPEPIIRYEQDPNYYGIGEITFVIKDDTLHMYFSEYVDHVCCLSHAVADLSENWPSTIRDHKVIMNPRDPDSVDAVYVEDMNLFLLFSIEHDNRADSRLMVLESVDGVNFVETTYDEFEIEPYAHSLGVEKDKNGHIRTGEFLFIGYAYGDEWAEWSTKLQIVRVNNTYKRYLKFLNNL